MSRHLLAVFIVIVMIHSPVNAETDSTHTANQREYSRRDILALAGSSVAMNLITIANITNIVPTWERDHKLAWYGYGLISSCHLPLYHVNSGKAFQFTLSNIGLASIHLDVRSQRFWNSLILNYYYYTAPFSSYTIYREMRTRAKSGAYANEWQDWQWHELAWSPLEVKNLRNLYFSIPLAIAAFSTAWHVREHEHAIWNTNKAYLGSDEISITKGIAIDAGVNMAYAVATAVGEEAMHRGVIYEELKTSLGSIPAKVVDMLLFSAAHIPRDKVYRRSPEEIRRIFFQNCLLTLTLDVAYDKGGLPLAVTFHMWYNTIISTINWAASAGVPSPYFRSAGWLTIMPITLSIPLN